MKLLQYAVACVSLLAAGAHAVHAQTAPATAQSAPAGNTPVLKIGNEVVQQDQLTSFAAQIAQFEAGFPPEGAELLNEFILTRLADRIPTTATVAPPPETPDSTPVANASARTYLKRLFRAQLLEETEVPREELEAWYEENKETYQRPEEVYAWHIFRETSDENETSSPENVRQQLQQVKAQIDAGTSFSEAARQHSEAASSDKGGEIGRIRPRQPIGPLNKPMNIELERVFFSLPVKQVSDVVETRHGMHLLYITDKKTTVTPTVDDLLTSGILPGNLAQNKVTSRVQTLIAEAREKYNAQVLPGFDGSSEVTTDTVVFTVDGRETTLGDLAVIFGPRFVSYVERIRNEEPTFRSLMEQGLEDELSILAAVEAGLLNDPETSRTITNLITRDKATQRITAIVEAEATVSDDQVQAKYDELKEQLRRPEAEGYMLIVHGEDVTTTDPAEQARARENVMLAARELAEQMQNADFDAFKQIVEARTETSATLERVPRHIINNTTDPMHRQFDRAMATVNAPTGVSQPVPSGNDVVVAKVEARHPGEPVPLEEVADRIKALLESESRQEVRANLVKRAEDAGLVEYLPGADAYRSQEQPEVTEPAPPGVSASAQQTTAGAAQTTAVASQTTAPAQ